MKSIPRSRTPEYSSWASMIRRCTNEKAFAYHRYGGRGITVCKRWLNSFENFLSDMGLRPSIKHSLDRINNDGNYEPSNCRWATIDQQMANTVWQTRHRKPLANGRIRVDTVISPEAKRKLVAQAKLLGRTPRKHASMILEERLDSDNGLYATLHPKRQK